MNSRLVYHLLCIPPQSFGKNEVMSHMLCIYSDCRHQICLLRWVSLPVNIVSHMCLYDERLGNSGEDETP